jgi:serine phosphatase RsbU (regulator of sigma subunit)
MGQPDPSAQRLQAVADTLIVGLAIADPATWKVTYQNRTFAEWFPAPSRDDSLAGRFQSLREDRARRRIEKGRAFTFDSELRAGNRPIAVRTTLREVECGDSHLLLIEAVNVSKEMEQEHMLDSFAKLADRNKVQLEKANAALSEKTEELQRAYDLIKAQKDRMERELEVARQVQMNMLPKGFAPNHKECTVAGTLMPALEVGGDFFDFFYVDVNRLCFVVGDVSDKGAASGLFMAAAKTLIKAHATRATSTAGIVGRVNRELSAGNDSCMFVTLFIAILDMRVGEIVFTNAGHNCPYLLRQDDAPVMIRDKNGPAVGVLEAFEYSEGSVSLERGDLIVVYSDGVTEAMNELNEAFGEPRLEKLLSREEVVSAETAVRSIVDAVQEFEGETAQSDDVTVAAVMFHGP